MHPSFLKRHNLVAISQRGRDRALSLFHEHYGHFPCSDHAAGLIAGKADSCRIPGIIRREEKIPLQELIPVGFVAPFLEKGKRIRLPSFVYPEDITAVATPFELIKTDFEPRTTCLRVLAELKCIAQELGVQLGVWGSAGLEIHTCLHYTNPQSDLDLLTTMSELKAIQAFYLGAKELEVQYNCRIDLEIDLPCGYGIQAVEFFGGSKHVLAKGIDDVTFILCSDIVKMSEKTIEKQERNF